MDAYVENIAVRCFESSTQKWILCRQDSNGQQKVAYITHHQRKLTMVNVILRAFGMFYKACWKHKLQISAKKQSSKSCCLTHFPVMFLSSDLFLYKRFDLLIYAVECRYNAVQYTMVLHKEMESQQQSI